MTFHYDPGPCPCCNLDGPTRAEAERAADWPTATAAPWTARRAARARAAVDGADGYPVDPAALDWPPPPPVSVHQELIRQGPLLDEDARDIQTQNRPSIIRRILNARKAST
ncbi:hypothetical protein [Glycomyces tenuis]|uniref:hypothetical protein n=1 Tax=Glycomyces tenuis TaxID=58116 RepID=UPI0003FBF969|nr:hypothetical protein [Glycomyces tenuis]